LSPFVSLLRGINVSGQKRVPMPELKRLYESLGFLGVQTYVQSGNVVFASAETDGTRLETTIAAGIRRVFGFEVAVLVRQAADLRRVLTTNPFLTGRHEDPARLHVTFLAAPFTASVLQGVPSPNGDGDEFAVGEREIFLFCPGGYGNTRLAHAFFERKLKVAAATRNWNSVTALHDLAQNRARVGDRANDPARGRRFGETP
jgi:uncharacterized protein (DUF1697 family)